MSSSNDINCDAPIEIMKAHGGRGCGREQSGGGGGSKRSAAEAGNVLPPFWYTVIVAGAVYFADAILDGPF